VSPSLDRDGRTPERKHRHVSPHGDLDDGLPVDRRLPARHRVVEALRAVADAWGVGWVLLQAVAAAPTSADLNRISRLAQATHPALAAVAAEEFEARSHRDDPDWWHTSLQNASSERAHRQWIVSLLSTANTPVVVQLSNHVSSVADGLSHKYFQVVASTLRAHQKLPVGRTLFLNDALRRGQGHFSARALWLARIVSSESSYDRIDKLLEHHLAALVGAIPSDILALVRVIDASRGRLSLEVLRGHRRELPNAGWIATLNLPAMSLDLAAEILQDPVDWPSDMTQQAALLVERRMVHRLEPMGEVADTKGWFQHKYN